MNQQLPKFIKGGTNQLPGVLSENLNKPAWRIILLLLLILKINQPALAQPNTSSHQLGSGNPEEVNTEDHEWDIFPAEVQAELERISSLPDNDPGITISRDNINIIESPEAQESYSVWTIEDSWNVGTSQGNYLIFTHIECSSRATIVNNSDGTANDQYGQCLQSYIVWPPSDIAQWIEANSVIENPQNYNDGELISAYNTTQTLTSPVRITLTRTLDLRTIFNTIRLDQ